MRALILERDVWHYYLYNKERLFASHPETKRNPAEDAIPALA